MLAHSHNLKARPIYLIGREDLIDVLLELNGDSPSLFSREALESHSTENLRTQLLLLVGRQPKFNKN